MKIHLIIAACLVTTCVAEPLNFNRDIRPILSDKCFSCHGPDSQDRDADYRLDTKEGAFADLGGYAAIVPGDIEQSELIYRITTDEDDDLMPPAKHKKPLSEKEIDLLKRWIEEGAPYAGHWAFEPVAQLTPANKSNSAIDGFIQARLEQDNLKFSPEAPPETLIRRLYLDLTGLPPTPAEVDTFLKDPEANYEPTIDRLLQSPHFAERLALEWLDVARFADTNGYSIDDHREMWGWRDWVIQAFQTNLPYDQFIQQQIAGDLMPNATQSQKVATGFLRNSMNTHEGGTIAEEYRVAYIADKIDTVSTAFMGLTMKCAQCHDHKYDPISMRDYYQFFAFFNTSSETGRGGTNGNAHPLVNVEPLLQNADEFRESTDERIAILEYQLRNPEIFLGDARNKWEQEVLAKPENVKTNTTNFPFPEPEQTKDWSWIWANKSGSGVRALFRKTFTLDKLPAKAQLLVSCDNEAVIYINGHKIGENPDWRTPTILNIRPRLKKGNNIIAIEGKDWQEDGKGLAALFALAAFSDGTYIGTDSSWKVATKGVSKWPSVATDPDVFTAASPVAQYGKNPWGDIFAKVLENEIQYLTILQKPHHQRNQAEQLIVSKAFAKANSDMKKLTDSLNGEIQLLRKSKQSGKTTVMVMDSSKADRKTPILLRGAYDQHGEFVTANIPAVFGKIDKPTPNRLDLANWLIDPAHPLTARVTVNRYWQMIFGTGLVKTAEDFGSQSEWPSHPELLDWLAADFVANGWDVRALLKNILLTRTYRQSSDVSKQLRKHDPYNRLLARSPRFRLSAESVRDNALVIAGLLDRRVGGASVYPPQPRGLWKEVSHFGYANFFSAQHFFPDQGRPAHRRSMYTFWKRTSPPPLMATFDAPNRETCAVQRSSTNTPLQALALMNEPQFVEAAQALAGRMLEQPDTLKQQIDYGFRLATARRPTDQETSIFESAYHRQLAYFSESPERTEAFLKAEKNKSPEMAAMSSLASLILNLDETITRE